MNKPYLVWANCLDIMPQIPNGYFDAIICDPPYGTTACKWDSVIPLEPMWQHLKRIIKPNGAIVLFGSEPFSSKLRMSNIKNYKHDWVWKKSNPKGFLNAKKYPLKVYEIISIFCQKTPIYNPQFWESKPMNTVYRSGNISKDAVYRKMQSIDVKEKNRTTRYPQDVISINDVIGNSKEKVAHPTQKPVALMEYLIKTYTNEGEKILDFAMGSGTTGVACVNLKREFVGIEKDPEYFKIAQERILK